MLVNDFVTDLNNFHRVSYCRSSLTLAFFYYYSLEPAKGTSKNENQECENRQKSLSWFSCVFACAFSFSQLLHTASLLSVCLSVGVLWLVKCSHAVNTWNCHRHRYRNWLHRQKTVNWNILARGSSLGITYKQFCILIVTQSQIDLNPTHIKSIKLKTFKLCWHFKT